jgi:hypothetical protein
MRIVIYYFIFVSFQLEKTITRGKIKFSPRRKSSLFFSGRTNIKNDAFLLDWMRGAGDASKWLRIK